MIPQTPEFAVPILKAVVLFSSAVLLFLSEPAINRMSQCSKFITRLSFHLLAVGGAGNVLWVMLGDTPNWPETIVITGAALLLLLDRVRPGSRSDRS